MRIIIRVGELNYWLMAISCVIICYRIAYFQRYYCLLRRYFLWVDGIIIVLIYFKGISELKDRRIDLINIFHAAGRTWEFISIIAITVLQNLFLLEKR